MVWQATPWADPLLFSTVISGSLAVFGLLYVGLVRRDRRVLAFVLLMLGVAVWTFGYSLQFASATASSKHTWATVAMAGQTVVPAAWFTFAVAYARRERWLELDRIAPVWIVPILTLVLMVTNRSHGLVWEETNLIEVPTGEYLILERTMGPWLLVHGVYSYAVAFGGVVVIIGLIERSRHIYRGQATLLSVGILIAAVAHLASLAEVGPASVVDLTPASLAVLGIAFAVGIFRYRMFDLVPIARASIFENMREGYVLLDDSGKIVDYNTAARSLLAGRGDEQLIGKQALSVFAADLSAVERFDGNQLTETIEITEDGDRRFVELTVSTIETDRVSGTLVRVRDVTGRIQVQQRFQTLIEESSDIVFLLDSEGTIEYVSPSIERTLGYDPDELIGEASFDRLVIEEGTGEVAPTQDHTALEEAGPDGTGADDLLDRLLPGEEGGERTVRFEVQLASESGDTRTIEGLARDLLEEPTVEGIVINARDVTVRKEREMELRRTNERLDEFASLVSHDLRNPLNVAVGNLHLAMETGDESALETVEAQHRRMETMIDDLLTLARDGREVEETSEIDLGTFARETWGSVETEGASLVVEGEASIVADETRLRNLFENLYRNSVEHGTGGEVEPADLTVWLEPTPDGFAVSDSGVGIPEDERDRVFDSGQTTESGNTGFGLAIVEEIAEAHGWQVSLGESDAGGARFVFRDVEYSERTATEQSVSVEGE